MKCKKLLAMLLAAVMVFALAACGKDGSGSNSGSGSNDKDLPADVQAIVDRGVLRVGVKSDVPGFGLQDVLTEEYSGLEIDLANEIAKTLGIEKVTFTGRNRSYPRPAAGLRRY